MIINTSSALPRQDLQVLYDEAPPDFQGIADIIMPEFAVPSVAGKGYRATREEVLGLYDTQRAPKSAYKSSDDRLEDFDYAVQDHGLTSKLDDSERRMYASAFDYAAVVANRLRNKILRKREYTVASALINTTNFPLSGTTGHTVGTAWSSTSATPIADVNTAVTNFYANSGMLPNTLVLNWLTARWLSRVTEVYNQLATSGQTGVVIPGTPLSEAQLAGVFGIDRVVIAKVPYNSAKQGQTASISDVWNNGYAFLCRTSSSMDISEPCIGRMWRWTDDAGDLGTVLLEQYRDEDVRSDVLRARFGYGVSLLDSACGYLIDIVP